MATKIGENAQRIDGPDKVRGNAIYGADRAVPKMAFAIPVAATVGNRTFVTSFPGR
ncbi:xanthine dehydrogenase YagR molybdenum-binding subunit [Sphingomonas sp. OK281]|nr:xanthine dehydrogenase YagR molybdenum-binding subunit [Sphingomonas sp. OK281]